MVMEGPPAPHCVGREFVRQYYTLLNQAPAHLHRFYNNNSSFVHGGLDSPQRPETKVVVGQKQIHQKIQQLNFRDCHAKISQVDSQATLGDGVVVQVTGELSNSGQPMRRFTQTFVLAAQTPKKFYVHNDIFRYQDMLFPEEDNDVSYSEGGRSEGEEGEVEGGADHVIQQSVPPHGYYNNVVVAPVPVVSAPPVAIVNGTAHPDEVMQIPQAVSVPVAVAVVPVALPPQPLAPPPQPLEPPAPVQQPQQVQDEPEEEVPAEEAPEEVAEEVKPALVQQHHVETVSSEPKTYATLVKSGGPVSFASAAKPSEQQYSPPAPGPRPEGALGGRGGGPRPQRGASVRGMGRPERDNRDTNRQPRQSFNESDRDRENRENISNNGGGDLGDRDRRRGGAGGAPMYTDSQQLFLGNLPHHATELELKEVFRKFGTVVDLRIHSKPNAKNVVGNRSIVPNYGFVIFESPASVQDVLSKIPIYFPEDGSTGVKLNVEEKKTRPRHSLDSGVRPSDQQQQNPRAPPVPRGGMRGGMTRGGGGPRGGFTRGPIRGGGGPGTNYARR